MEEIKIFPTLLSVSESKDLTCTCQSTKEEIRSQSGQVTSASGQSYQVRRQIRWHLGSISPSVHTKTYHPILEWDFPLSARAG